MTAASTSDDRRCVFCAAVDPAAPSPLVVFDGVTCFVVLNKFPYSNGHLLIVPRRHVGRLTDASVAELHEMVALTRHAETVLDELYAPDGLNVGMNLGRPAGAGVPGHLHVHVVPRWAGDTNFMTVTADTRVVPEELDRTAQRLRPLFERFRNS